MACFAASIFTASAFVSGCAIKLFYTSSCSNTRKSPPGPSIYLPINIKQSTPTTAPPPPAPPPRAHARSPRHEQTAGKVMRSVKVDDDARYNQHVATAEHVMSPHDAVHALEFQDAVDFGCLKLVARLRSARQASK